MGKVTDAVKTTAAKVEAFVDGWTALPRLLEKNSKSGAAKLLRENDVRPEMADILFLIRDERARLEAVIAENENLGNAEEMASEMGALRRFCPTTPTQAKDIASAITDCQKRLDRCWFGRIARRNAEIELSCLTVAFQECFDGSLSPPMACLQLPAAVSNAIQGAGFDLNLLTRGPWREVFTRAAARPRRRRIVNA